MSTSDALKLVTGQVGDLTKTIDASNQNNQNQFSQIGNQISGLQTSQNSTNSSISNINTKLNELSDAQKTDVANRVKMGEDINKAISDVTNAVNTNQAQNQQQFDKFGNLINANQAQNLNAINGLNTGLTSLGTTVNQNQATTNQALQGLSDAQKAQANALIAQGVSTDNAIKAVQGQIGGLDKGLNDLTGTVGGIGKTVGGISTDLTNLTGTVGGLGQTLDTTNKTIAENQEATNQALKGLSDAQKEQVASQVAMGVSLTTAIKGVQSSLLKQSTDASNAQQNRQLSQIQANAIASGTQAPTNATSRGALSASSLDAAPVYGQNTKILGELKQMYPQLSQMNPKLLSQLGLSSESPLQQVQNSQQPPSQQVYVPSLSETNFSDSNDIFNFKSGGLAYVPNYAMGGDVHVPEFITGATGHYVKGRGDGQSDDIPAMLADGEYVFDADTVAQLGNGSSDAGAKLLDHFRQSLREHKRSAPSDKIPPKASPLMYMKEALKRHERK